MASSTMSVKSSAVRSFTGLRPSLRPVQAAKVAAPRLSRRSNLTVRADGFIGSTNNLIIVASTTLFLAAGRFGLTPSANRLASPGLKLSPNNSGLKTGDPAGFTATDVLYLGTIGHVIGIGTILGLKAIGKL
ncbi:g9125 [Coccomyxa elongata]